MNIRPMVPSHLQPTCFSSDPARSLPPSNIVSNFLGPVQSVTIDFTETQKYAFLDFTETQKIVVLNFTDKFFLLSLWSSESI